MVALLFALSSVASYALPRTAAAWDEGSFNSTSEKDLIALTNRSRAAAGLRALKVDSTLTSVARWRSKDMITRDYFSHDIPGYGRVFKKLDAKGYCYKLAGENIGWNTYPDDLATAAIHKMFMDSSGHRRNILNKAWDVIGVGCLPGPRRQEDVDRPVRRQVRRRDRPQADAQADPQADRQAETEARRQGDPATDPQADAKADPQAHALAHPLADTDPRGPLGAR